MLCLALHLLVAAPPDAGYERTVAPFLATYCHTCHAGDRPKGGFRVDPAGLPADFGDPAVRGRWKEVADALNGHDMPPKKSPQPPPAEVAAVVDWVTARAVQAELARRESAVVLRRLNRDEYRNTVRDLLGVDYDTGWFPQDPLAGGFDNNGGALTLSPLHVETYLTAARQVLDLALVDGPRPRPVTWRFVPRVGPADRVRQRLDARNNPLVNGGNNRQEGPWVVVRHDAWDTSVGVRDFRVPQDGTYAVRVSTAARVPGRDAVARSADALLAKRRDDQDAKNPPGKDWHHRQYEADLAHFRTDRMYGYGPPRVKLVVQLGPQPRTVAEFDAGGTPDRPAVHEVRTRFTTETAGISVVNAYSVPSVLENFWLQRNPAFARPELLVDWIEIEGPLADPWPPASHTAVLPDPLPPPRPADERAYAAGVLARFMRKAYRRPVAPEEVAAKLKLYDAAVAEPRATFVGALSRPLAAVLVSPHFLYLAEPAREAGAGPRPLTDHQLAARLSYFLWAGPPDDELAAAADAGRLRDRAERRRQVDRMLADPKADRFVRTFADQWLGLREVGANPPASDLFPHYDRHLETSFVGEGRAFFREVLTADRDVRAFLRSDFVTVNERLARFYGLDGVRGDQFRAVPVPAGVHRGGLVTQGAVLSLTSNGTRTSPVKRGTWVLKTLLGLDPGLPVANAGEIAPKVPGVDKATVRVRLEAHRRLDQCARCHDKIDPLGFALENFDAAGGWRDREGFGYKGRVSPTDPAVDSRGELTDGTKFAGVEGLQEALLKQEDFFLACLAGKLLTYALGRELGLADRPTVQAAVAHLKANGRTLKSLIRFMADSQAFETK